MKRLWLEALDYLSRAFFHLAWKCDQASVRVRYAIREDFVEERMREAQRAENKDWN